MNITEILTLTTESTKLDIAQASFNVARPLFVIFLIIFTVYILIINIGLLIRIAKSRARKPFGNYILCVLVPSVIAILLFVIAYLSAPTIIQMFIGG